MLKRISGSSSADPKERQLRKEGRAQLRRLQRLNKTTALAQLKAMDPILFEYVVAALFEQKGYRTALTVTSGDEGVDVLIRKGLKKGVVQCKRYDGSVGQPVVRDLYGTMLHNRASESYLVTTAMITKQAQSWSQGKPIHLVDGYTLVEWMFESKSAMRNKRFLALIIALGLIGAIIGARFYWPSGSVPDALPTILPLPLFTENANPDVKPTESAPPTRLPETIPPAETNTSIYLPLVVH